MGRLKDKVVLVTGAAGAIGSAIADAVVELGGIAVTSDLAGRNGVDHALDVTSEDDWLRVVAAIGGATARLDGLVNAAGIASLGTVEDIDLPTWRRVMAVNLDGTFLGCKYALRLLKRTGGSIVNISSVSGLVGGHNLAAYNASKGAVRLLTKSVALYGARLDPKVRCNSVHPAFIEGPMVDELIAGTNDPDRARKRMTKEVPLGRFGRPSEVADMCVYLLSDESAFVTGAEFVLDGGLTAQ
jgi:NAD(P)-dependent dehydrogenase (short-subunit alcohol dehydrogenase family)